MASTKEYQYMGPSFTQTHGHKALSGKNTVDLSPMDLDFSSAMNLNNSMDTAQTGRHRYHHPRNQQQQQQNPPAPSHASRHSSFQLPSFASLISGGPCHSVPFREHMTSPTTTPAPSNATPSSMRLPRLDDHSMQLPLVPPYASLSKSSPDYPVQQPVFGALPSTAAATQARPNDTSAFDSVTSNCNQECYSSVTPHSPNIEFIPTTTPMADISPKPASAKKGRRTRKPKFISRVLNANMQWSSNNNSKNNDGVTFRPYQYEPRRPSQQQQQEQQQHQQEQQQHQQQILGVGRQRISSIGTSSSSLASSGPMSSSTTIVDPSPSSSTTPSIISNSSATMVKPRWQETERMDLLKAIVKEKQLDDMTSFSWDKISLAVGRAKKACKDQYRREILPALMEKLK
ncbi:hypothetical protein BCR42DRAFT_427531 [Absidia repens]|uniref:Myb-like domain-containing protein n=1 Tax=Absidia repens TaxID=90262 RepID=A0A1X2HZI3_9FUNG|nr:hypothetical protein BCR42DRAFT_427531 [Absidia repens]